MKDYQTHTFTCTYTADVSGVCSALYELGGMSVIHDPSGCNSTYSTHDEPRWFDGKSLMFVSGLDEMTAVLGDDSVVIDDISRAAKDLHPRFIALCGGSIPHIIAFDYRGASRLIEKKTGIPVLPCPTDGLKSYVSGVGIALTAFIRRFADPLESPYEKEKDGSWRRREGTELSVNLIGATPLDFGSQENIDSLRKIFTEAGIPVNACAAMGDSFDTLAHLYRGAVNVVISSAGRRPARFMRRMAGIPRVEGLPIGSYMKERILSAVRSSFEDGRDRILWEDNPSHERWEVPGGQIVVIGEEVYAQSAAAAVNSLPPDERKGRQAFALWPDVNEGFPEEAAVKAVREADTVIADPLYRVILPADAGVNFVSMPHVAYSGRIFINDIPNIFSGGKLWDL